MSSAAKTAPTYASPTTPAATGIVRSAKPSLPRSGWPTARPELLPVPYFHVVFTLPGPIADIAYHNKAVVYDQLLKVAAETLITIAPTGQVRGLKAHDPKHLGARIGLTAVLHTWGSALTHHPQVHIIVPGGAVSFDGQHWIACRPRSSSPSRCSHASSAACSWKD